MAFATEEVKTEIANLLRQGKKVSEIIASHSNVCAPHDIKNLRWKLQQSGEIAQKVKSTSPGATKAKQPKIFDEFQSALNSEIKRIETEIERMNGLSELYDSKNASFAIFLDKKIQKETKKLTILQELQN